MTSEHESPGGDDAATPADLRQTAYDALRGLAAAYLRRGAGPAGDPTLQPTALVHEAYLKLAQSGGKSRWNSQSHFQAVAATAMRQILVDRARRKAAHKHGGGRLRVTLVGDLMPTVPPELDVIALDDALRDLEALDRRKADVVELRFFGGLTSAEAAAHLDISPKTAEADWYFARAWLRDKLIEA